MLSRFSLRHGGTGSGRAPYPVPAKSQLGSFTLDSAGGVVGAEVRGTVHWLPGQDGQATATAVRVPVPGLCRLRSEAKAAADHELAARIGVPPPVARLRVDAPILPVRNTCSMVRASL